MKGQQNISDDKKISGYIPLTVYKNDKLMVEGQDENNKLSLFTYNFNTEKFEKVMDNACLPKYFGNSLYYVDITNKDNSVIMKNSDWDKTNQLNPQPILKSKVIEDFRILENNQVAIVQALKNASHYELLLDDKIIDGAMVNSGMLSTSKYKAVIDYYYDSKVRVFNLESKDVDILREGNQVSNISIFGNQVIWQELDNSSEKVNEKRKLFVYNLE
ncbi:hypothetical protein BMT55_08255 [Listeria newyorkensis]|uniref:Uncharacterized protein n=1 Tax=Listeria newyorkensis TaxID=1497681 RepID=A0ABX4XNM0_9LIST|nr:hypothetical protein [Listeria newyorkensis]PNP92551.1 hypothetical protein BMT55_08255 [Listeria newyorkensis]